MRAPAAPRSNLWLFAVECDAAQFTWSRLGPGQVRFEVGDRSAVVDADGGPGSVVVDGLPPDHELDAVVSGPGVPSPAWRCRVRTLAPPPGRELYRFATVSDLHLGESRFGYFGTLRDPVRGGEPHPVRATRAAIAELRDWGAQMLVVKGDVTHASRADEWEAFIGLVDGIDIDLQVIGGNHDSGPHGRPRDAARDPGATMVAIDDALAGLGLDTRDRYVDLPGLRMALADTTVPRRHLGKVDHIEGQLLQWAGSTDQPVLVVLHHQLMRLPFPTFWPPGVPAPASTRFVRRLATANPASMVTSGHTHRHRRCEIEGVVITEVGSPKDFPGTWAGYVVHEGGIRQVVRRVGRPDVLRWTDWSGRAGLGLWRHWAPGRLDERCFTHVWPSRSRARTRATG